MVSFQCDACQDIVKKPKLDQHRSRGCAASFTCIDCSQTFATPADWKGHTSCISESQKYQKSLYRPKVNGGGREQTMAASTGKFQGRGGSWARPPLGRPRYQATGANGTPLGTPTRMSPVTITPPNDEAKDATVTAPAPTPAETAEPGKEKQKKTSKKRKLDSESAVATEALEPEVSGEQEESKATAPTTAGTAESTKEKKKKSSKKRKLDGENAATSEAPEMEVSVDQEVPKAKEKEKKDKKGKKGKSKKAVDTTVVDASADGSQGLQDVTLPSSSAAVDATSQDSEKKSKKGKEKRKKAQANVDAVSGEPGEVTVADSTSNGGDIKEEKKKKKKKQDPDATATIVDGDASMADATATTEPEEKKKTKKRKRAVEGKAEPVQDGADDGAENGKKNKKKKKISTS